MTLKQEISRYVAEGNFTAIIQSAAQKQAQTCKYVQMNLFGDDREIVRWHAITALGRLAEVYGEENDEGEWEWACEFVSGGYTETPTVDSPLYASKINEDGTEDWYMLRGIELLDNPKMECWELLNSVNEIALFKTMKGFGVGDDDRLKDLCIYKKDDSSGCCLPMCYEYNGEGFIAENFYEKEDNRQWCDYCDDYCERNEDCDDCPYWNRAHPVCELNSDYDCNEASEAEDDNKFDPYEDNIVHCGDHCEGCPLYKIHHPEKEEKDIDSGEEELKTSINEIHITDNFGHITTAQYGDFTICLGTPDYYNRYTWPVYPDEEPNPSRDI